MVKGSNINFHFGPSLLPPPLECVAVIGVVCPYQKFGQSDNTEQINTNIPAVLRIIEDGSTLKLQTSKYHNFKI